MRMRIQSLIDDVQKKTGMEKARAIRDLMIIVNAEAKNNRCETNELENTAWPDDKGLLLDFELKVSFLQARFDSLTWTEVKGEVAAYCARVDEAGTPAECRKLLNLFYSKCITKGTFDIDIPGYGRASLCCSGTLRDEAGSCIGEAASHADSRGEDGNAVARKVTKRLILALANLPEIAANGIRSTFVNSYSEREREQGIKYAYAKGQVSENEQAVFSAVLTVRQTRNAITPYHINPEGSEQYKRKLQYLINQIKVDGDGVAIRGQMKAPL